MNPLHEIAQIVSKNKSKRIEIIGHPSNYNSKLQKLYEAFSSGNSIDEENLTTSLFPDSKDGQLSYSRLKRRLFKKLINTLFFIDTNKPTFTEIQRAYYSCYRDYAAMKILIGRSGRGAAIKLGEQILKRAFTFEFTDLSVDVLRSLRTLYSSVEGNRKEYIRINQLFKNYKVKLEAEDIASEYYSELAVHFVNSRAVKKELAGFAKNYSIELENLESSCDTQQFVLFAYNVHAIRYQIENDFEQTILTCEKAIEKLKAKGSLVNVNSIRSFLSTKTSAHIKLGNYKAAEKGIAEGLEFAEKGTINWFISMFYSTLLFFHSGQYQKSYLIFEEAVAHPKIKKLPAAHREYWTIANAYLNYLIAAGEIELNLKEKGGHSQFRIQKFLNNVPLYSQDKRGANISILILQVLFLLQQKKYEDTISRLENLKAYSNKYLRKNETFRSNCFIHMLLQLPNAYFNKIAAIRKTKNLSERLKEVPLEIAEQSAEMEMIPYEKLWEMVLKSLKG